MAMPLTERSSEGLIGPDPGRTIRIWVALLLRFGIGLSLLNSGLTSYYGMQAGRGGGAFFNSGQLAMLDPFLSGLPYLMIATGLALMLGFLTTASSIAAGFSNLIVPIFTLVQIVAAGPNGGMNLNGRWNNDPLSSMLLAMSLPNLLIFAAMIWLSPLANNPISVDAMIFGRNELEPPPSPVFTTPPVPETVVVEQPPIQINE